MAYKETLKELLHLHIVELKGDALRNQFTANDHTWSRDPDLCCSINKVEPLEKIKPGFQVWVSGLMHSQTSHRKDLEIFRESGGLLRFYPILDKSEKDALDYIESVNLPLHPLFLKGFHSVGCTHCTKQGKAREGRWIDRSKTECGLHL